MDVAGKVKDGVRFLYDNGLVDVLDATGEAKDKVVKMA